ncbi:hypothetical protein AMTRI_Chr13g125930 [Amborella trichopoda]|uniref:Uncharacterized protein n=1 Tax=Amborella trichopoda TaxID=13333 RepID=U5CVZ5_AMBTC|nr:uncharacterized protein LOC18445833 [Amborella trichopoda]ERN17491.1 hypothetical protein AMTR_s00059p00058530 [Amborella trichopoda]|eukprot:XP_006856024.1 uncharacterized protein LOC18445833 [Amborella trichopoda]
MITRSKLVEQLREYQIRSQHKWATLSLFSPKTHISTRGDLVTALLWALLFLLLITSSSVALYFRHLWGALVLVLVGVLLLILLEVVSRIRLARKRRRRMLLPLSM